ncbi:MAG: DUF4097 domain-containing protein [Chloroflexi bacterium]|nr:DUF4097 domain-containing protein [Chloroflexota bacterium]
MNTTKVSRWVRIWLAGLAAILLLWSGTAVMQASEPKVEQILNTPITPAANSNLASPTSLFYAPPITPSIRPLGIATDTGRVVPDCLVGWGCYRVEIQCPQLSELREVFVHEGPSLSSETLGTVLFFSGWDGTFKWGDQYQPTRNQIITDTRNAGYRAILLDWRSNWWQGTSNQLEGFGRLGCRPATAVQWIYDNLHDAPSAGTAFCATGHSNGASQLAYAVSQYDLANLFTMSIFESGPNWSRVDQACLDNSNPYYESGAGRKIIDRSFGELSGSGACFNNYITQTTRFEETSITYNNWPFNYPDMMTAYLFGGTDTSKAAVNGQAYHDRVVQASSPWVISSTLAGVGHDVTSDANGADLFRSWLFAECRPSIQHVANTVGQCDGNTPCEIGTSGFYSAVKQLPVSSGTIIIHGNYQISGTTNITRGRDITIQGVGGATIQGQSTAVCNGPLINIGNGTADVQIEDLTFDGDANCTSGQWDGIRVNSGSGSLTFKNLTIQDMNVGISSSVTFSNTGNSYLNNVIGVNITGGDTTLIQDIFTNNGIGVRETSSGAVNIGTGPTDGSTFTGNTIGIESDGGATIKGNTISGGTTGISLSGNATAIYGNSVTGASNLQIDCNGALAGAAFNYLGGNSWPIPITTTNCSDSDNQLGAVFTSWTEGTALNEATSSAGPIFDLGNNVPFGFAAPTNNSNFYAVMNGAVTITGGNTQFKMFMDATGCNPMTAACWESAANGRTQTGPGYFFNGSQDPTTISLSELTTAVPSQVNLLLAATLFMLFTFSLIALHRHKKQTARIAVRSKQ